VELEVEERHLSQYGIAHGGVAMVLLDTVGGVDLLATRPELARLATISLSANFIGPVRPGLVLATAKIQRIGGSVAYTSMALHAGTFDGELLATAHGAYRLLVRASTLPDTAPAVCPSDRGWRSAGLSQIPGAARGC
jgi:uncharacterized protein (TIGR00369 family)